LIVDLGPKTLYHASEFVSEYTGGRKSPYWHMYK
jgi:hypothetical protein